MNEPVTLAQVLIRASSETPVLKLVFAQRGGSDVIHSYAALYRFTAHAAVSGDHLNLIQPPHVRLLAARLREFIDKVGR